MKKLLLAMAGVSALALSTVSLAGGLGSTTGPASASGAYITAGLGYGVTDLNKTAPHGLKDYGIAWLAGAGYQFNANLALEGGYINMAHIKYRGVSINPHALYLAGKGIIPVSQRWDIFAKAGAAYTSFSASAGGFTVTSGEHKIVPLFGIGTDYYLTNNLAITVQGLTTLKESGFPATYMGTAGLTYKFAV